jgi:LysR family nitrogen assimilation transcriptional regulator
LKLDRIQYFLAVMEHQNLSEAAQALRVSQPTLSRQMRALEREFDAPLFVRHGRGIRPTEAGKRLHEGLKGWERQLRSLKNDVAMASLEPTGEVAFGIPPSPRSLIAVPLIKRFVTKYPKMTVRVSEETSGELRDQVAAGVLDIAISNLHEPMRGVTAEPLGQEQMLLVGPRNAPIARLKTIQMEQIAQLPLILTTNPNSLRLFVETELNRSGVRPNIRIEANTLPLMTDLVVAKLGYTVLPACGVRGILNAKQICAITIEDYFITWLIAIPKSRPLSIAAERFCTMLREIAAEQIERKIWRSPPA